MEDKNSFQDTIKAYLDKRAEEDPLFAIAYAKKTKNIKDCCSYITSQAKKAAKQSNCAVILNYVVFGWRFTITTRTISMLKTPRIFVLKSKLQELKQR